MFIYQKPESCYLHPDRLGLGSAVTDGWARRYTYSAICLTARLCSPTNPPRRRTPTCVNNMVNRVVFGGMAGETVLNIS